MTNQPEPPDPFEIWQPPPLDLEFLARAESDTLEFLLTLSEPLDLTALLAEIDDASPVFS